jgi:hypothetical protein
MTDMLNGVIKDLLGGKGFGGIADTVKNLGSDIAGIFGGGGGDKDVLGNPLGSIPGVGGGAGSAAGGAAGAGITGLVGVVSGVVSAISGVIGNFQFAAMNKSLDLIEKSTRYSMLYLSDPTGILGYMHHLQENTQYLNPLLDGLNLKLIDWLFPLGGMLMDCSGQLQFATGHLADISNNTHWGLVSSQANEAKLSAILDELRAGKTQPIINLYVNGVQQPASSSQIRMQGVLAL